jgi:outer membrane protein OmpA-like peptidoglycan-associated protein
MDCVFESGNQVIARADGILLSKNPPAYKLIVSPALFTPDGDGENDNLTVSLEVTNPAPIVSWSLGIYKKMENGARGPLFREFAGTNAVKKIFIWDGMSGDGQDQVEAVQDYVLVLNAEDALGNKLTNVQKTVPVGVLVEKTAEGLRIRVSSVQFDFNSARLAGDSSAVLDKVIAIIRKILSDPKKYGITENYRIEIGGHTDDVGSEEYNQKLSERRAQSVYDYFIEKDVDPKILTSVGYGKTRPYKIIFAGMENDKKEEYRARNRRVEFFIRK